MKKIFKYILILTTVVSIMMGCKREDDYIKSSPSAFISNFDIRKLFKETDLSLNSELLRGATSIKGVVISDFRSGNSPAGLLILQNSRMAGNGIDSLRGMAVNIGSEAANYVPGDSVHIKVEGAILKRVNGILQILGLKGADVNKIATGRIVKTQVVTIGKILSNPNVYESTLVTISSALVVPEPGPGETFLGDKTIDDGSGIGILHTEASASFASNQLLVSGNFTGITFINNTSTSKNLQLWMRSINDFRFAVLPKLSPAIITGYLADPNGTDANYEYIQFLATKNIDFSLTPFSVYTTNNAGSTNPFPTTGWNLGGARTYKFNLTVGKVSKGEYFYVGGTGKLINGLGSTDISAAKWISSVNYTLVTGSNGIGSTTTNLLANSGNIAGISIFEGVVVNQNSLPLDVIFYGGVGGNFYSAGPPAVGYRITNTDFYSTNNPSNGTPQPFIGAGTNTFRLGFPIAISFASLGGEYDAKSGRWNVRRALKSLPVSPTSTINEIEGGTKLVN
jgi:hypothetical protein